MQRRTCCSPPVVGIANYGYGSEIKSHDFHFAPLEKPKSMLPYPHRHDFYHIVWVTNGTGWHIIDSARYEVRPDTLFFMAPGQIHDFSLLDDATGNTINFSSEFFALKIQSRQALTEVPIYSFENLDGALYLNDEQARGLRQIMDAMIEEYRAEESGHEDVIWSYLRIFLMKISRITPLRATADMSSRSIMLSRRFKSALEKNFGRMNETADYARLLKVTERALNEATRPGTRFDRRSVDPRACHAGGEAAPATLRNQRRRDCRSSGVRGLSRGTPAVHRSSSARVSQP